MVEKGKRKETSSEKRIEILHKTIDKIDEKILDSINQRLLLAKEIGSEKGTLEEVIDQTGENEIIQTLLSMNQGPLKKEAQ